MWSRVLLPLAVCCAWLVCAEEDEDFGAMILSANSFRNSVAQGPYLIRFCDHAPRCQNLEIKWNHLAKHFGRLNDGELKVGEIDCSERGNVKLCADVDIKAYPAIKLYMKGPDVAPLDFDPVKQKAYVGDSDEFNMDKITGWVHKYIGGSIARSETTVKREVKKVYEAKVTKETSSEGNPDGAVGADIESDSGASATAEITDETSPAQSPVDLPAETQSSKTTAQKDVAGGGQAAAEVDQSDCPKKSLGAMESLKFIVENKCTKLQLSGEPVDVGQAMALAAVLGMNTALTRFSFGNPIGQRDAKASAGEVSFERTAKNWMDGDGLVALIKALENTQLESVYIGVNGFNDAAVAATADLIQSTKSTIKELHLVGPVIGPESTKTLAAALKNSAPQLETFAMKDCDVGSSGTVYLAQALVDHPHLTTLDLGANNIGNAGAEALGEMLSHNNKLHTLGLYGAQIGVAGMRALARGLTVNRALRTIYLVKNKLGVKGAKVLAAVLGTNFGLTHIYCAGSGVGYKGANLLLEALDRNALLQELSFGVGDWHWDKQHLLEQKLNRNKRWAEAGALNMEVIAMYHQASLLAKIEKLEDALDECTLQSRSGGGGDAAEGGEAIASDEDYDPDLEGPFLEDEDEGEL
jgi:Ran GTPase-activating protein (RanGAP) involved in mRNA processing and transport